MSDRWTEEEIAAFVDGSLDDAAAKRIAAIIERDSEARALAEEIAKGNDVLRAAFADVAATPIPPALAETLAGRGDTVVPFRKRIAWPSTWIPAAAAASIAIVVGLGIGAQFGGANSSPKITLGDAPRDGGLHLALETLPSGMAHEDRIMPMLTFTDASGRYCREFEVVGDLPDELEFGIACRSDSEAWHVEIIVSAPMGAANDRGFAPASGPGADALAAMIEALGGGGKPLAPGAEASVIDNGWQP
ncbi:MAG: hypothetical protein AAGE80_08815 [Pseudomonadota bacterium]